MFNLKETKAKRFYYNDLYYDYIFNFNNISEFYFYDYHKLKDYSKRVEDIIEFYGKDARLKMAELLEKANLDLGCSDRVIENIKRLRDKNTFVVIGGQQPGLLTGPAFIIYKILSIIKISSYISKNLKINTVPVFWNASDDSNFNQIDNLFIIGDSLKRIKLDPDGPDGKIANMRFSDIYLSKDIFKKNLEDFFHNLGKTDFSDSTLDFLNRSIDDSINNKRLINPANFFSVIISRLFSRYGLIVLDPSLTDFRKLLIGSVMFDIEKSIDIKESIKKKTKMLMEKNYHTQLSLDENSMDFFLVKDGIRNKVYREDEETFSSGGNIIKKECLQKVISENFDSVSPNVVLRPIFQDTILPVLGTVCGPGEISYFAQLKDAYNIAKIKTGILFPRFSATIIENKILSSMKKIGISFEDLDCQKQAVIKKVISKDINIEIENILKEFVDDISLKIIALKDKIESEGIDTKNAFNRIENNIRKESKILKKRIFSELKKKDIFLNSSIEKIYSNIFPAGKMQERIVNIFNYVNKYDFCLIDSICDNISPLDNSHKFLIFDNLK